jgi:predicted DNA-binding protein YlxM (UPF0122 family)
MQNQRQGRRSKADERAKLRELLERFGSLLTERQTEMVSGYAVQNLSFSEIARRQAVSRQAVHEAVRAAERILTEYESKLRHLSHDGHGSNGSHSGADLDQVVTRLESLKTKIAHSGIIYSVDWIRREIDTVMELLTDPQMESAESIEPPVPTESALPEIVREALDSNPVLEEQELAAAQ